MSPTAHKKRRDKYNKWHNKHNVHNCVVCGASLRDVCHHILCDNCHYRKRLGLF